MGEARNLFYGIYINITKLDVAYRKKFLLIWGVYITIYPLYYAPDISLKEGLGLGMHPRPRAQPCLSDF